MCQGGICMTAYEKKTEEEQITKNHTKLQNTQHIASLKCQKAGDF